MIRSVGLTNFKRFARADIELGRLTLLTGLNSGGKSSCIQALLLLHSKPLAGHRLALNGPFGLHLGEAADVLHFDADDDSAGITLSLVTDDWQGGVRLVLPDERATSLSIVDCSLPDRFAIDAALGRRFTYLSAERLGPRELLEVGGETVENIVVGEVGQYTAHVLTQSDRVTVPDARLHPETAAKGGVHTFKTQVEFWMRAMVGPLQVDASWIPKTTAATLRFKSDDVFAEWQHPGNVGFGISYALPIVVAALAAPANDDSLLIVENPEVHLHPSAQSAMGAFLARIAGSGVQVVLETHSDHVVNGVRRAVALDHTLAAEDVVIQFFGRDTAPQRLWVTELGRVSDWPAGFFDQADDDLHQLAKVRRRG